MDEKPIRKNFKNIADYNKALAVWMAQQKAKKLGIKPSGVSPTKAVKDANSRKALKTLRERMSREQKANTQGRDLQNPK